MFDKKYWVMSYWFFIYFLVVLKAKVTIVLFCFCVSFLFICLLFFFLKIIFKTDKTEKLSVDKMYNCGLYLLINNWKKKKQIKPSKKISYPERFASSEVFNYNFTGDKLSSFAFPICVLFFWLSQWKARIVPILKWWTKVSSTCRVKNLLLWWCGSLSLSRCMAAFVFQIIFPLNFSSSSPWSFFFVPLNKSTILSITTR